MVQRGGLAWPSDASSAVVWVGSYVSLLGANQGDFDKGPFWQLALMTTLVLLTFANLGFLGSVFITRNRTVYSSALGLVLGMYARSLLVGHMPYEMNLPPDPKTLFGWIHP